MLSKVAIKQLRQLLEYRNCDAHDYKFYIKSECQVVVKKHGKRIARLDF